MEFTSIQREILTALVNLYRQKKGAVKGDEIAEMIGRNPGTIRNQMQSLKALHLVEGVPGPKGGYRPTSDTYHALSIEELKKEAIVPIHRNEKPIINATVSEISFTTVRHPDMCNGRIRVIGNIRSFEIGDKVQVGPTPVNKLIIRGDVIGRDDTENTLLFSITEMVSLPKRPVKSYIKPHLITVPANATIQEASRILVKNNLHGAPVIDKNEIVGIVTFTDIGKTLAEGKINLKIRDIMTKEIIWVDGDMPLHKVVRVFDEHNVGRLLVKTDGEYRGVISKTDVLHQLAVY